MSRWLAEGRTLGLSLRRFHAVVVAGVDLDATANVALGIAEAQSEARHVVLGDLTGSTTAFAQFVSDDDPHGLVDAFDYGISLARVSRPVPDHPQLQFAPTGAVIPDYGELLAHPRWARLKSAFTEADHLLVVTLPVGAPAIEELVHRLDGLVLVDAMTPAKIEPERVIANVVLKPVSLPRASASVPAIPPAVPSPPRASVPVAPAVAAAPPAKPKKKVDTRPPAPPVPVPARAAARPTTPPQPARPSVQGGRQTGVFTAFAKPAGYGAGLSILAAFIIFWLSNQPFAGGSEPRPATPRPLPQVLRPKQQAPPPKPLDPNEANPADSGASVYAVRLLIANTQAGAILKLQEYGPSMPAATYAPVEKSGTTWYEVLTGAFTTRGGADSLLSSLRSAGKLDSVSPGVVVRVPYTVRIDSVRRSATVSDLLVSLSMRQLPVYALEQRNGWVWVVAGAFETRSQAESYSENIRARGQPADVVLRQGRMF